MRRGERVREGPREKEKRFRQDGGKTEGRWRQQRTPNPEFKKPATTAATGVGVFRNVSAVL